ncbi:MAG TPA: hypothetical protein GXZ45_13125 [Propionibacterium sp.]|nr:hypothetical protein [Propionibacterium sp.]
MTPTARRAHALLYGYTDADWDFHPTPDAATAATLGKDPGLARGRRHPFYDRLTGPISQREVDAVLTGSPTRRAPLSARRPGGRAG